MCGIAGLWSQQAGYGQQAQPLVAEMLACLRHRGPDDEGLWSDPIRGVVLGQRRLAIIDLSPAGHQPMLSEDEQLALTFNGEIYNFRELKGELEAQGVRFRSQSDTEVLLKGYERWGTAVLDRLVGMYAFAIWDGRNNRLFLARDRAGEKPLYYAQAPQGLAFASEMQAFHKLPWVDRSIDPEALALYLNYQYVPAPKSIYRGVAKLPPAHAMLVDGEGISIWRYWDPLGFAAGPRLELNEEEALERLEDLMLQAVRGQMIADVPLGAFLSGGIDSSLVVSLMTELASGPVKTFTIGFDVPGYNEAEHAAAVAGHLGTDHTCEYLTQTDALDLIPCIPDMYGEPFADASALPTHLVAKVARKRVTVSLSGDGGDEAFGGYDRYNKYERFAPLFKLAAPVSKLARPLAGTLHRRFAGVAPYIGRPLDGWYRSLFGGFKDHEVLALTGRSPAGTEFERAWSEGEGLSARRQVMLADMLSYMPEDVLTKVDRAAMATSLETRAPLLDHRVLEFSLRLPESFVQDKVILKHLAYRRVPKALLDRPKQGFSVPLGRWFRHELRELLRDSLTPESLTAVGISEVAPVERLLEEHLSGGRNHAYRLWTLLSLCLWRQRQQQYEGSAYAQTA